MNKTAENETLDPDSFKLLAELAYSESGLSLAAEKVTMIQSRLRKRLRALKIADFPSYATFVGSKDGVAERKQLISALTTNVSHFFREDHHYDILIADVIEALLPKLRGGQPVRIWSAGCSNGQEAYSAAISILEAAPDATNHDLRILGTDIDREVVKFASQGQYPKRLLTGVSKNRLSTYFSEKSQSGEAVYSVGEPLRKMVHFRELNLHAQWPLNKRFDAIFCRNVVIYFDKATQEKLWPRFCNQLTDQGRLFLGHSERITNPEVFGLEPAGATTYKRIARD